MTKGDEKGGTAPDARETRLAQALRANLRRRKAPAAPPPAPKVHETSPD